MVATEEGLPVPLRRDRMAAIITERGFVRVAELSRIFRTSPVTVRTDLEELAALGLVRRVHGGAVTSGGHGSLANDDRPRASSRRPEEAAARAEHAAIGSAIARRLDPGSTVVVGAGPAAGAVADAIALSERLKDVTVVTNALDVALTLGAEPGQRVVVTGGTLDGSSGRLIDPLADRVFEAIVAHTVILCPSGVSAERGVTVDGVDAVSITQRLLACGGTRIAAVRSSGIGADASARAFATDAIDVVVTPTAAPAESVAEIREQGVLLELVNPEGD